MLPAVALLTMLSGIRLMQLTSDGFSAAYFNSGSGRVFAWGGTFAIIAFVFGMTVARPAGMKLGRLSAQPPAEDALEQRRRLDARDRLQRIVRISGLVNVVLLLAAAVAMAIARYL